MGRQQSNFDDASYIVGQTIYADGGRLVLNYTVPVKD